MPPADLYIESPNVTVALIHKNKHELQKMLDITDEVSKRYHIKFGKEKSQTITIGKNQEPKLKLGNMVMDNTETYKYLGITINNKGTMEDPIHKLKGKMEAALQTIFNLAGNKNFNQIEMKMKMETSRNMHPTHTTVRSRNMDTNKDRSGTHTKKTKQYTQKNTPNTTINTK